MNAAQAAALFILSGQAVVAYLLAQGDIPLEPVAKVGLGVASVLFSVWALYLKVQLPGRATTS